MQSIQSVQQFTDSLKTHTKLLVWFSASWCTPCQNMEKRALIETASEKGIPLFYTDQTVVPELTEMADIRQMPTFVLFVDGKETARRTSSETAKVCMWMRKL